MYKKTQPKYFPLKLAGGLKTNLSTATVHWLSIRSDAVTKAAGRANAVKSALNTVIMAPSFINSIVTPAAKNMIVNYENANCSKYTTLTM